MRMWMDVLRKEKVQARVRRNERVMTDRFPSNSLKVVFEVNLQSDNFIIFTPYMIQSYCRIRVSLR